MNSDIEPLIVGDSMQAFVRENLASEKGILGKLRIYGENNNIPIIHPEVAALFRVVLGYAKPKRILEIGCAIGYSSILFKTVIGTECKIDTIELSPDMVKKARRHIEEAGFSDSINVIYGDCMEVLEMLQGKYDMVFVDGPKAKYIEMLPNILRLLEPDGLIVSDNIFYRGFVAVNDERIPNQRRSLVRNLREYIKKICDDENFETTILSIGDGVGISKRVK